MSENSLIKPHASKPWGEFNLSFYLKRELLFANRATVHHEIKHILFINKLIKIKFLKVYECLLSFKNSYLVLFLFFRVKYFLNNLNND